MTDLALHFVDPTIPGLSGRDLVAHAADAIQLGFAPERDPGSAVRRDFALRRAFARLDTHLLRDLGFDRDAS